MRTAKVVIEIIFKKNRVPKQVLEDAVMKFSDMKDDFIGRFMDIDADVDCRVFFETYSGTPKISIVDLMNDSRILRKITGGRKNVREKR